MPHATTKHPAQMESLLPIILCLHGHGTSASIFEAQTRNIRAALRSQFQFVYVDAPYESAPGPGVLPCFADSGPYYTWFPEIVRGTTSSNVTAELSRTSKYVSTMLAKRGIRTSDVVAVMGFSQGTIIASLLLLQAQWRDAKWGSLQFGIMLSGACRDDMVMAFTGQKLRMPSVHLHGLKDPHLDSSRMLAEKVFQSDMTNVLEFDGGHYIPASKPDLDRLTAAMKDLGWKARLGKRMGACQMNWG